MTQPQPARGFPNIERLLAEILAPHVGGEDHVGNETPDNLVEMMPFIRIERVAGGRGRIYDYPVVEIDWFYPDEIVGQPAVSDSVDFLLSNPPPHPSLDTVDCDPGPRELPWDNEQVRHWGATFFFTTRRVRRS